MPAAFDVERGARVAVEDVTGSEASGDDDAERAGGRVVLVMGQSSPSHAGGRAS